MESLTLAGKALPRIGIGCWAIGGPFTAYGRSNGWGEVDDAESLRALALAYELGARLFDTSNAYGMGHSEQLLAEALRGRHDAVIATKFGYTVDKAARELNGTELTPEAARRCCAASLRQLRVERIDLYQIHVGGATEAEAQALGEALEALAEAGDIGVWGWSTNNAAAAATLTHFPHFRAVQQGLNVLHRVPEMERLCDAHGLVNLNRAPLAMGFLTGKFTAATQMPPSDVRGTGHDWVHEFRDGRPTPEALAQLDAIRDLLQAGGRTMAQGALGWNLARSPQTVPIPGIKTEAQVRDNLGALHKGPLPAAVMAEIDLALAAL